MRSKIIETIEKLKKEQECLQVTDYISEDDFELVLQDMYEWEQTYYHMRTVDPIMFREEYLNYCDSLGKDGWLEETDDYKELQHQIEELNDLLADIEDSANPNNEVKEFQERYEKIVEEF